MNNSLPAPLSNPEQVSSVSGGPAVSIPAATSTFTRRPLQKSEAELLEESRALQREQSIAENNSNQHIVPEEVNLLHEIVEPARTQGVYVQKKLAGEPVAIQSLYNNAAVNTTNPAGSGLGGGGEYQPSLISAASHQGGKKKEEENTNNDEYGLQEINSLLGLGTTSAKTGGGLGNGSGGVANSSYPNSNLNPPSSISTFGGINHHNNVSNNNNNAMDDVSR